MRKFFIKTMIFLMICLKIIGSVSVAGEGKTTLYEKYGFQEDFKYGDETIAHALKSSVVYIELQYTAEVEYDNVFLNADMVEALIDANPNIKDKDVVEYIIENINRFLDSEREETTEVSFGVTGSGVVISEDGYIATNAHVVNGVSEEEIEQAATEATIIEILKQIISDIENCGLKIDEEQISDEQMIYLLEILLDYINSVNYEEELYVYLPSSSGKTSKEDGSVYEAEVIEVGVAVDSGELEGFTQDAAIIKIDAENMIALELSDSYPESNAEIVSAGFPAAADEIFSMELGSGESVLSVTIGKGNISRHIPIEGTDYKAMEITTTISNGSSGGPSVDTSLDVEGLNTYGNSEDIRFAYMIPSEYVNVLAEDYDIGQGDTTKIFLTGLQMLQEGYGAAAVECFEEVYSIQNDTPYIESLCELASKSPQKYPDGTEKDKSGNKIADKENAKTNIFIFVFIVCASVMIVALICIMIISTTKAKSTKKRKVSETFETTSDLCEEKVASKEKDSSYVGCVEAANRCEDAINKNTQTSDIAEQINGENAVGIYPAVTQEQNKSKLKSTMREPKPEGYYDAAEGEYGFAERGKEGKPLNPFFKRDSDLN